MNSIDPDFLKIGSCALVMGVNYFKDYFPVKKGYLLKVTKICSNHNEFDHLNTIKQIKSYENYYALPENEIFEISEKNAFHHVIQDAIADKNMSILKKSCVCFFVKFAGDRELFDTINDLYNNKLSFWRSDKDILNFIKQIMRAICYLHEKKLCHLDIKPENIMVDTKKRSFKLIDFGFTCMEPFDDFVEKPRGTPGYFPNKFSNDEVGDYFPQIYANDMIRVAGKYPFDKDRRLVYLIDSYCLGRIINLIKNIFDEVHRPSCFYRQEKKSKKIKEIIIQLLENNVRRRSYITDLYEKYFVKTKKFITNI